MDNISPDKGIVIPGSHVVKHGVLEFTCPVCANRARGDDAYEPICTGPHPSLDEHEPAVMVRTAVTGGIVRSL